MTKINQSAGLLLYRMNDGVLEFFLVHPGGPFFKNKDEGAWSIPKGEFADDEDGLSAAIREFEEETGQTVSGKFSALQPIKQKGGKTVYAWAAKGNVDANAIISNTFELEWPPKSGKLTTFPEIDRAGWFDLETAQLKINQAQVKFIEEVAGLIK